jgi:hypothetical protein
MKADEPEKTKFAWLGSYSPKEAAKLLERLQQAGIPFRAQPKKPLPEPGPTAVLYVSVESARASEAAKIHRELFGDGLPNYESSFFREHRNV